MTKQEIILRELELLKELREITVETPVKDKLEWGERSKKSLTWEEAKKWCEEKGDGWRMPTRMELLEAYENKVKGFKPDSYWSASTYQSGPSNAYIVDFDDGDSTYDSKTNTHYVRCIRDIK